MISPGEWIGLLGGGQLGRMFTHSAQALGYRVVVLDPAQDGPAAAVADAHIQANYDDASGLIKLAEHARAVTTEFENVPAGSLAMLGEQVRVTPGASAVRVVQDRIAEKSFISDLGVSVAPHLAVRVADDLKNASADLFPGILKVARLGYDGKGQARVKTKTEALTAYESFGGVPCVLEALLDLKEELSVIMARGLDGECAVFPVARNVHHEGILAVTVVDTFVSEMAKPAKDAALAIAHGLKYAGVMCVEFFVLQDGRLLVNEIAPRPHNSGHYSMNACATSQFEQQARVMTGLPLGSTELLAPVVMLNVLGDAWYRSESDLQTEPDWSAVLKLPRTSLHLYGKTEARRGRKMGHINCTGATLAQAVETANKVVGLLNLPVRATVV